MAFNDLFAELEAEEKDFLKREFLSPALRNRPIRVKISDIVMTMNVTEPKNYTGWGVFQPTSYKTARLVREPTMQEKAQYLQLFPAVRFVLCRRTKHVWYGMPANESDRRFLFRGLVPVSLAVESQMFDTVIGRFDGQTVWFERQDPRHTPKNAVELREHLLALREPEKIELPGWTREEREAYNFALLTELENQKETDEDRIKTALKRAGAEFRGYVERGNTFTVEITVDGRNYRPVIDKDTLAVQSAGICLVDHRTGIAHDSDFDLQSLVTVYREGHGGRQVHRDHYDDYYDDDDY